MTRVLTEWNAWRFKQRVRAGRVIEAVLADLAIPAVRIVAKWRFAAVTAATNGAVPDGRIGVDVRAGGLIERKSLCFGGRQLSNFSLSVSISLLLSSRQYRRQKGF